jgi:hypothetical protein
MQGPGLQGPGLQGPALQGPDTTAQFLTQKGGDADMPF